MLSTKLPEKGEPENDLGHVHDNSTIVSHAYYLMAIGGTNEVSKITVGADDALGWDVSQRLWHTTLHSLDRAFARTMKEFARVNMALGLFTGRARTVACAWRAVEVLDDAELALFGITCDKGAPQSPVRHRRHAPILAHLGRARATATALSLSATPRRETLRSCAKAVRSSAWSSAPTSDKRASPLRPRTPPPHSTRTAPLSANEVLVRPPELPPRRIDLAMPRRGGARGSSAVNPKDARGPWSRGRHRLMKPVRLQQTGDGRP